jgi:Kyanoviridae NAD synthetase
MTWYYKGKPVTEEDVEGYVAFVYCIENTATGRLYLGKKRLRKKVSRKPLKGKKRRRISYKESDWRVYWGSNEVLQEEVKQLGPDIFTRTILRLCKTLSESSYYETKYQFEQDVLLRPKEFYNEWLAIRIRSSHLKHLHK